MIHRSFLAMASALLLGLLMAALASTTSAGQSTAKKIQLKAFDTVQICTPLSVLILPLSQDSVSREESPYSLAVEGEAALHQSIRGRVSKGVLYIESAGSFEIHENAKITVGLLHHLGPLQALKCTMIQICFAKAPDRHEHNFDLSAENDLMHYHKCCSLASQTSGSSWLYCSILSA